MQIWQKKTLNTIRLKDMEKINTNLKTNNKYMIMTIKIYMDSFKYCKKIYTQKRIWNHCYAFG